MEIKHAILLGRVSTQIQSFDAQTYDLTNYAKSLGYTEIKIIESKETAFADITQKVGLNETFKYIKDNPEYKTIFVTEISRLARRQSILHQIKEYCLENQIQIYIKDLNFKLLDDDGKINQQSEMIFTLYGMFSESEVKGKIERFTRKRKELKEQGLSIGGKILFGYDRFLLPEINKNTLVVNDEQATIIRTIFDWYLNGIENLKKPSIKRLSIECVKRGYHPYTHSKRNVNKLLKEQAYTGFKTTNNKWKNPKFGIVANEPEYLISQNNIKYPPIISNELFEQVQLKLTANITTGDKDTKHITLLAKLVKCPSCGRSLQGNYRIRKHATNNSHSYRCTSRGDTKPCDSKTKTISMNLIDSAVWSLIKTDLPALSQKVNEINPDEALVQLNNQLTNLSNREIVIKKDIDDNTDILKSISKLRSENIKDLIQSTGNKLEMLDNQLTLIQDEKIRIETSLVLLYDRQSNIEDVINTNLEKIESSKELLKKYINTFVDSVIIVENTVKYTVLEIGIRDYGYLYELSRASEFPKGLSIVKDFKYVILDKTVTRNIKGAYYVNSTLPITYIPKPTLSVDEAAPIIKDEIKSKIFKIGKELNYKKLNV